MAYVFLPRLFGIFPGSVRFILVTSFQFLMSELSFMIKPDVQCSAPFRALGSSSPSTTSRRPICLWKQPSISVRRAVAGEALATKLPGPSPVLSRGTSPGSSEPPPADTPLRPLQPPALHRVKEALHPASSWTGL